MRRTYLWKLQTKSILCVARVAGLTAILLALSAPVVRAQSTPIAPGAVKTAEQSAKKTAKTKSAQPEAVDPGERAFQANCNRCHNAPEQLPRSISGTVLLHMRVRASLSAADERALLNYFAP
jgi:hypothetical protein